MESPLSRQKLVGILKLAHAGELAAALAYEGHAASVSDPVERAEILRIRDQELDHRARVGGFLARLGEQPGRWRERKAALIGRGIGLACRPGGWFFPMYGAGRLESRNVGEYEAAARFALDAGFEDMVPDLLEMAEVEWDHERYFRSKCESHWLWKVVPHWAAPPARERIQALFAEHRAARTPEIAATREPS